jgi:type II secretory pathway pseudopilin PulG
MIPGCAICCYVRSLHRNFTPTRDRAFTILELLVVIAIIIILAGLILSTVGYVQKKAARSRAETEIAAISAACESYRADNGTYPRNDNTDALDPTSSINPTSYGLAGNLLYQQLSGDLDNDPNTGGDDQRNYIAPLLKPNSLAMGATPYLKDPWGNAYGYSTMRASNPTAHGYNPTFDLWSTAGYTPTGGPDPTPTPQDFWIKNW